MKKVTTKKVYEVNNQTFESMKEAQAYAKSLQQLEKLNTAKQQLKEVLPVELFQSAEVYGFVKLLEVLKTFQKSTKVTPPRKAKPKASK